MKILYRREKEIERVLRGRWRLKAAWRWRRSSGEEEEEEDDDDSWLKVEGTRLFVGLSGRLASLSIGGSQLHLRFGYSFWFFFFLEWRSRFELQFDAMAAEEETPLLCLEIWLLSEIQTPYRPPNFSSDALKFHCMWLKCKPIGPWLS